MLYVLCGPSYCGKSTYANELKNHISAHGTNVTIINPDSIREELMATWYSRLRIKELKKHCQTMILLFSMRLILHFARGSL